MEVVKAPDDREKELTRMIKQYSNSLLNMCYIYLRDRELAEDALQETFLKAYRTRSSFRGDSHEKTWLTRIAINTCRDMRRSAWFTHVNRAVTPEELPLAAGGGFRQEAIDLANAIMQLADKYKEVILLYYYQEMKLTEIARVTGLTPSAVSRRIKKAHARLHELLGKEYLHG